MVQQIAALVRQGCRVTVIVFRTLGKPESPCLSTEELGLPEEDVYLQIIPVLRLPEKLSSLPGAMHFNIALAGRSIRRGIKRLQGEGALEGAIVHGLRYFGLSLPMWSRQLAAPVVLVFHGVESILEKPANRNRLRKIVPSVEAVSSWIVMVGTPLRSHVRGLGFSEDRMTVVPNGTELLPRQQVSKAQRSLQQNRVVVSVSNLVALKGIDLNLQALARVQKSHPELDWTYLIVGDGEERINLEVLVTELGLADRVNFMGRIPYSKTMQVVANSDIFCLPSWGEAFGIVYLEAMARSRPVIGCLENGGADFISHGEEGLLVTPRNISMLTSALEKLLLSPELCSSMGQKGRERSKQFSWNLNAKRMLDLLN